LIENLSNSQSYEDATFWGRKLLSYSKFNIEQINKIAHAYVSNDQIHRSFMAAPNVLYILRNNQKRIKPDLRKMIRF
jgi:DNA-dependent RNA polymerase auxiliary subunit epsilon